MITFNSGIFQYELGSRFHSGRNSAMFHAKAIPVKGKSKDAKVLIRIPHEVTFNSSMQRESQSIRLLSLIARKISKQMELDSKEKENEVVTATDDTRIIEIDEDFLSPLKRRFPNLIDEFELDDKSVNVFLLEEEFEDGWFSIEDIRNRYPNGVDSRHAIWIFNRILETLMLSSTAEILHNRIVPNTVLLHVKTHVGQLVDWTNSCNIGSKSTIIDDKYVDFYPPEVKRNNEIQSVASDIYMSAMCIVYLLGGDVKSLSIPKVEEPIRLLLNKCLQPNSKLRYRDVSLLYSDVSSVAVECFGPRKFVELKI